MDKETFRMTPKRERRAKRLGALVLVCLVAVTCAVMFTGGFSCRPGTTKMQIDAENAPVHLKLFLDESEFRTVPQTLLEDMVFETYT